MYTITRRGGVKALGVMYGLPFALLIWACVLIIILHKLTQPTELQDDFLRAGIILRHLRIE